MPLHPPRENEGSKAAPDPAPRHARCCRTIRAASLGRSRGIAQKKSSDTASEHPQLCRSPSARAEREMHPVIFIRDLLFPSPCQSRSAFTARAVLSLPRCNSQESISTMATAPKSTELSADVQLLQYVALCGRCSRCLASANALKNRCTPPPKKKIQRLFPSDFGRRKSGAQITKPKHSSRSCWRLL